jgi:hypothetical protein
MPTPEPSPARPLAVLALVAACALLAGLLAGCGDDHELRAAREAWNDLQINDCRRLGGVPRTKETFAHLAHYEGCDFPCPPDGGWPGSERELREGGR